MIDWLVYFFLLVLVGGLTFFQVPVIDPPVGQLSTVYPVHQLNKWRLIITDSLETSLLEV
ncbi:hypothetical protein ACE1TI_20545 [Alteribacillus sp. JSM 102045]|uniref:hypothetical protein n=1 Tax=Alteribacillus sp. JSM 102045 TaxID=1562101 RepID=UPI0035C146B0